MGKAIQPIRQSDHTIVREIVLDAVRELCKRTGFPSDADVFLVGETQDSRRNIRNHFSDCYDDKGVRTKYRNYVFVDYTDEFTENGLMAARRIAGKETPDFNDTDLGLSVHPEYAESKMSLTLKFRANDRTRLNAWVNSLRLSDGLKGLLYDLNINYEYSVPYEFVEFIHGVYKMREAVEPYGDTFAEYTNKHFQPGMAIRSNSNGSWNELIIREEQTATRAMVNEEMFYNTKELTDGIYEVQMPIEFYYKKIIAEVMYWPVMVHNQYIPDNTVAKLLHPLIKERKHKYDHPLTFKNGWLQADHETFFNLGDGGARSLEWDDWFPKVYDTTTQTVFLSTMQVDDQDRKACFSVYDLDDSFLPGPIAAYLTKYKDNLYKPNMSLVRIEVIEAVKDEKQIPVTLTDELAIRTVRDMSKRVRNYVRISIYKDLAKLSPVHLRELLEDADIFLPFLKILDPSITTTEDAQLWKDTMPEEPDPTLLRDVPSLLLMNEQSISQVSFHYWLKKMQTTNEWYRTLQPFKALGVGQYNITAMR